MRLFYCFELPHAVRAQLYEIAQLLRAPEARVSWVRPENFHITVKFLGEVEPSVVEPLKALGAQIAERFQKSEIVFDTVGAFPTPNRPRVLWIGSRHPPNVIFDIQEDLEQALTKMGFEAEQHFMPHVTVGRIKDERTVHEGRFAQMLSQIKPFESRALLTHLTLMESQLSPGGAIYIPVASWEFQDAL